MARMSRYVSARPPRRRIPARRAAALLAVGSLAACGKAHRGSVAKPDAALPTPAPVVVALAESPVVMDGRLGDPVWAKAAAYPLIRRTIDLAKGEGNATSETGVVRFARDADHLYAAFEFADRDVVQEVDEDQQYHYRTGDVAELFLKPAGTAERDATHYWEFYATPNGRKTALFFPGRGRLGLPSTNEYRSEIRVAAHVEGTLNDWRDEDRGWTAEMAIPLEELAAAGVPFDDAHAWHVLAARYNYGRQLSRVELSSHPGLIESFHDYEYWAPLVVPAADGR